MLLLSSSLHAQLASWDFEGEVSTPTTVAPNVTATAAVFGPSVGGISFPSGNSSTDAYSGNNWSTGGIAADRYLEISVEADPCYTLNISGISFDERRSGTGPTSFAVAWSTEDSFTPNTAYAASFGTSIPDNTSWRTQTFMETLSESKVIFRIFGWDAEGTSGTWRFDNIVIDGTAEADATPVVSCSTFTPSFDSRCPDEVSPNVPSGSFGPIPADGIISLGLGFPGSVSYDLDLSTCVSDEESPLGDLEIRLATSTLGTSDGCSQTLTNTYEIRDACGNIASDLVTIEATFEDTEAPTVTCAEFTATFEDCPAGLSPNIPNGNWSPIPASGIFSSAVGGIYIIDVDLNGCVSDNCSDFSGLERTLLDSYAEDFEPNCRITLVNEIGIRDACGNVADEVVIVKITIENPGTTPPAITCPADVTVDCGMPTDPAATGEATATDDCGDPVITFSDSFAPGCGSGTGIITRTWTATGGCDNVSTCEQIITIADNAAPVVTCADFMTTFDGGCEGELNPNVPSGGFGPIPSNGVITVGLGIGTGASYDLDLNGCVSDDCTDGFDGMEISLVASEVEDNDDAGSCGQTLTNTYSIRDACGNVSDDLVTIVANFTDTEAPTVTCAEFTATFEDCPVGLGPNTPSGDWVAIPASGIFSSAVGGIYVIDVDLNGCVSDNCSDLSELERTLVDSYSEDFEPNCRITLVNEIAIRDACGNVADELIVVKITIENPSTTPPAITCPADVTVDCDMSTEPSDTGEATATDDCGTPIITYSDSFVPGCGTGVGVLTRTWTATGGCGNVSTCEQIITVAPIAPTIVCPADVTIDCTDSTDPGNTGEATGDDSCGSVVTISFSDSFVEDCSPATGTLTRTWTATNACGLSTSCDQIITIIDETAPVFDLGCQEALTFTTEGGDLCPADATISLSEGDEFTVNDGWTVGGNPISPLSGCVSDDCTVDDALTITVDDITIVDDGTCSRTITLTLLADDGCGNVSEPFVSTYTFIDDTAPVFDLACQIDVVFTTEDGNVCPADATISLNEGDVITVNDGWTVGGVPIPPLSGCVDDNCTADNDLNITVDDITVVDDGTCSRTITVTFLADDGCDNVSEPFVCNYTFIDNTGPEVSFNGIPDMGTYVVECDLPSGTWDPLIETADLTITDNCSDIDFAAITVELTQLYDGPCVNNLLTRWQQVWVVPDVCGNETTYTLFTEIIDTTPPAFTSVPADLAIECDQPIPGGEAEAFDSCSEVVYNFSEVRTDGDCPYNYTLTRTWTASDGCGNSSTATQTITVEDTTPPEISFTDEYVSGYTPNQDVFVECSELGNISLIIANAATAIDNCSGASPTTYQLEDFGGFDCSEFGYSGHLRSTWTATDECGNTTSVYLNWFLVDETAPVFQGVPEDVCTETLPPVADVQAVDDCEFAVLDFSESDPIDCDGGQYVERTWTATDVCGNTASVTQRITLTDGNGPGISIDYPEIGSVADGDLIQIPVDCDEPFPVSLAALEDAVSIEDGCGGTSSDVQIELMGESDCDQEGYLARYNVSISARDACGNTSTFSLTVDLIDDTPPVVDSPAELSLNCGEDIPMIDASDACGQIEDMTFVDSAPITPSCPATPQAFERIWTITDQCGNSTTFAQSITIIDNAGPVFSGVPADACDDTTLSGEVTAIDECTGEAVSVSLEETTSSETDCGEVLTRTWTATDACGNTATATQQVFFADDTAPSLSFNHPLLFGLESGYELFLSVGSGLGSPEEPLLFGAADVEVQDNCAADLTATVAIQTELSADCAADGFLASYKYEWSVTDPCGNTSTLNLIVYYVDTGAPDFFDVPADLEVFCDAVPAPQTPGVSDDYDTMVELNFSEEQMPTDGGLLIIRTWTATDDCGNTNTATQEILVADNTLSAEFELSPAIIDCNSDDNLLSVIASGGLPPYNYSWELTDPLEDGYITSDPTKPTILFTMGFITQTFTVTITDANRCQLVQSFTVVCDFSGEEGLVGNGTSAAELLVYPNPASDYLLISAAQWTERPVQVGVYSLLGQEMLRKTVTAWPQEGHQIDTRMLPNGTYLLRLESEGKVPMVREIVVLH